MNEINENELPTEALFSKEATVEYKMLAHNSSALDAMAFSIGKFIVEGISEFGEMMSFLVTGLFGKPKFSSVAEQFMIIGVRSLPIVFMALIFTGFIAMW